MSSDPEIEPDFHSLALGALEVIERFYADLPRAPIMPVTSAQAVRDLLHEPLPHSAASVNDVLNTVRDVVYPLSRHNGHPRFFGYVASPGTAESTVAEFLAAALNANVTSWRSAPAAAEMEHLVIDWFKSMLGYHPGASGILVSGGSMANFSALAAARSAIDPDAGREGLCGKAPLRVYVSQEAHFSMQKAARLLGIGAENVQTIPTDSCFRIDAVELERRIVADRNVGLRPMCIVGTAGTVNTGAFDPIDALASVAERQGVWLHIDGAYGGFAALAPSARHLFAGIDRANSVSLDPHKWLYSSMGCGCVLYRDPDTAKAAFAQDAEYTRPVGLYRDEAFAFWDYGPELSRPFRALPIWLQIKLWGADKLAAAVENNIACARYFGELVDEAVDFELLAPVGLSIFCFRFCPPNYSGDLDVLNERILVELQRRGSSYLSNARVNGSFALRGCVLNYRTTLADMERLLADTREAARSVVG